MGSYLTLFSFGAAFEPQQADEVYRGCIQKLNGVPFDTFAFSGLSRQSCRSNFGSSETG